MALSQIGLFNKTSLPALKMLMDLGAARQKVHARNLANAETEGYERKAAKFSDELGRAGAKTVRIAATHEKHLGAAAAEGREIEVRREMAADGSAGVDTEEELVALAGNQLKFNLAARLATLKIAGLRASIQGRS